MQSKTGLRLQRHGQEDVEGGSQRQPDAAGEVTADCFHLASSPDKPDRLHFGKDPRGSWGDNETVLISSVQTDQPEDDGEEEEGQEGKAAGSELFSQHSNKQQGKRLSSQLWWKTPAARKARSTATYCVIYSEMTIQDFLDSRRRRFKPVAVPLLFSI